jgi:hypothetical protein
LKQFGKFVIMRSSVFDSLVGSSTICTNPWSSRMCVNLLTCWVHLYLLLMILSSSPGRLKSPAVMMNALVMLSALFMFLSNSKYPFSFDVFGL